jgi:hypothetical protein
MDQSKFDAITKRLSSDAGRRSIVKGGAAAALGALVGVFRYETGEAGCGGEKGDTCVTDGDCCSRRCGTNLECKCSRHNKKCKEDRDCCRDNDECQGGRCKKKD